MIRTGTGFLESLRDGRRVLCEGELIEDITTHPKTRGYAQAIAEYYDLHHDPDYLDVRTFVDENGERWAKHWFLPRNKAELVERRKCHDFINRKWGRGGMFARPPASMLPIFYTVRVEARLDAAAVEERARSEQLLASSIKESIGVTAAVDVLEPGLIERSAGKAQRFSISVRRQRSNALIASPDRERETRGES